MRVSTAALAFIVTAGCAPPSLDGAGGAPTIQLLYPQPGSSELYFDEENALHMRLEPDGTLAFTAVVDLQNITFVPPATDPVDGEAHWHLFLDEDYKAPSDLYVEAVFEFETTPSFTSLHTLSVRLQRNDHADLDCLTEGGCTSADVEDKYEFTLDPAE